LKLISDMTRRILIFFLAIFGMVGGANAQSTSYAQPGPGQVMAGAAEQLMALANQSRVQNGAGKLQWDESLAAAARQHCLRMAAEGPIAHRYGGEADVAGRAGQAGAHFDLIEENVAVGPSPSEIHAEWMQSPGHRTNLLNPEVNRVGIAVVYARGVLYATADYSRNVQALSQTQVETRIGELIRANRAVSIVRDNAQARAACTTDHGIPASTSGLQAGFVMRWQSSDLSRLPEVLSEKLVSGRYHQAAVGSCPAQGLEGNFTAYRLAVLLY
jgi:Cysteine-rich secretory protein family